jgi:hypothetical protein
MKRPYRGPDARYDGPTAFQALAVVNEPSAADSERHEQDKGEYLPECRTKQIVADDAAFLLTSMSALFFELCNNSVGASRDNVVEAPEYRGVRQGTRIRHHLRLNHHLLFALRRWAQDLRLGLNNPRIYGVSHDLSRKGHGDAGAPLLFLRFLQSPAALFPVHLASAGRFR